MQTPSAKTILQRSSIQRVAERVDDAPKQTRTNRQCQRGTAHPDRITVRNSTQLAERHQQRSVFSKTDHLTLSRAYVSDGPNCDPGQLSFDNRPDYLQNTTQLTNSRRRTEMLFELT